MTNTIKPYTYPFEMCFNSIKSNTTGCLINEPTMIIMSDIGKPLKIGEKNILINSLNPSKILDLILN